MPTAAMMSITNVAGSGTVAFAAAIESPPGGWPKLARHTLYPAGVPAVLRHTT
jgi:hypothetical protein